MIKKLLSVIICSAAAAITLTAVVSAAKSYPIPNESVNRITEAFRKTVADGTNYADISELNISMDSFSETDSIDFMLLLEKVRASCGCISFGKYSETYVNYELDTDDSNVLKGINITYDEAYRDENGKLDKNKLEFNSSAVSNGYSKALSVVKSSMTDLEKALVLYDYVITNVDYPDASDTLDYDEKLYNGTAYTVTGFFADRKAVCSAYAKVYALLLNDSGIPAVTVYSDEINHEWVMLKIDGEWYHADPTWDDTRYEEYTAYFDPNDTNWDEGSAKHFYFLKSDNEFRLDHVSWKLSNIVNPEKMVSPPKASADRRFSGRFFCQDFSTDDSWFTYSKMNYINGYWYFIDTMSGNLVSLMIDDDNPQYIALDDGFSFGKYAFGYGNYVFVSTDYDVYRYDTMSDISERVISLPNDAPNSCFSKMYVIDDTLYLTMYTLKGEDYSECNFITNEYSLEELMTSQPVERSSSVVLNEETDIDPVVSENDYDNGGTIIEELSPYFGESSKNDNISISEPDDVIYDTSDVKDDETVNTIIAVAAISVSVLIGFIIAKAILNSRKER